MPWHFLPLVCALRKRWKLENILESIELSEDLFTFKNSGLPEPLAAEVELVATSSGVLSKYNSVLLLLLLLFFVCLFVSVAPVMWSQCYRQKEIMKVLQGNGDFTGSALHRQASKMLKTQERYGEFHSART